MILLSSLFFTLSLMGPELINQQEKACDTMSDSIKIVKNRIVKIFGIWLTSRVRL